MINVGRNSAGCRNFTEIASGRDGGTSARCDACDYLKLWYNNIKRGKLNVEYLSRYRWQFCAKIRTCETAEPKASERNERSLESARTLPFLQYVIKMLYSDNSQHNRPHFHVYYAEFEASVGVDGELLAGSLPVKQLKLVQAWAAIHEEELYAAWNKAVRNEPFGKIEPLR